MNIVFMALFLSITLFVTKISPTEGEITPYKYDDSGPIAGYQIPSSSRFTTPRLDKDAPDIIYYFSKPKADHYPIAILCGGSSDPKSLHSIIHFHRYFLQEFLELGVSVLTVEQWGIDGDSINVDEFVAHYTRTQRLQDHRGVIDYLKANPPSGWNSKIILLGCSEGGPLVTTLTTDFAENIIATINWSGAVDWNWREQLWIFTQKLVIDNPECPEHKMLVQKCGCSKTFISRQLFDKQMDKTLLNPTSNFSFLGMTYKYHADAMKFPIPEYLKMGTPFLIITGALDIIKDSSNAFVEKARKAESCITYLLVPNMDHYVRKRPDVIAKTFAWLKEQLHK